MQVNRNQGAAAQQPYQQAPQAAAKQPYKQAPQPAEKQQPYGNGQYRPRRPEQEQDLPEGPEASHQAAAGGSQAVLMVVAVVLTVLGAVLLAVGAFVLKDPKPTAEVIMPVVQQAVPENPVSSGEPADPDDPTDDPENEAEPQDGADSSAESTPPAGDASQSADEGGSRERPGRRNNAGATVSGAGSELEDNGENVSAGDQKDDADAQDADAEENGAENAEGAQGAQNDAATAASPSPTPAPETVEPEVKVMQERSTLKLVLTIVGWVLLVAGAVMGIVAAFLQKAALQRTAERAAALQRKIDEYQAKHREPTTAEKLKFAFEAIPVLPEAEAQAMERAAQQARRPAQEQSASVRQAPVDPVAAADKAFNALLAQGGQSATQAILGNAEYVGASIDIPNCLNAYQGGQNVAYRVVNGDKNWSCIYFVAGQNNAVPCLYPNPYAVERLGVAKMQEMYYILNAFQILYRGAAVTAQNIGGAAGGKVVRVTGARLNAQGVVTQKGQIEIG